MRTPPSQVTVVTISGHRQRAVADSADFRTWNGLAERLGTAWCVWAGPPLTSDQGSLHVIRRMRHVGPRSVFWSARAVWTAVGVARAAVRRGETVVLNGAEPWGWLSAWLVSRIVRRPWLMEVHGNYFALPVASVGRWRKVLFKLAVLLFARQADARRVVAQSMVEAFHQRGIASDLVPPRLMPAWQEPLVRVRPPLSDGSGRSLLAVGRLVRSKGYDLLLRAVADLVQTDPALRLRIVGDGPEREPLLDLTAQLGLSGTVEFLGAGGPDVVRAELMRADVFVISSRDEGLPRTLLEAAACAVPVVATAVGGIPAATAGWPTVSVVSPEPASLAAALRQIMASPPTAEHLAAVRRDVLAEYGFAANLDALAALYRGVSAG